jgi:BioD-like phosphotransacetylase family protein
MLQGIYIIGTDTEVGKTVVAAGLMYLLLKKSYQAAYFKPVASGEVSADHGAGLPMHVSSRPYPDLVRRSGTSLRLLSKMMWLPIWPRAWKTGRSNDP